MQRLLTELPDEILERIFDEINLTEFPALSRTCPRFSLFTQPHLRAIHQVIQYFAAREREPVALSLSDMQKELVHPGSGMLIGPGRTLMESIAELGLHDLFMLYARKWLLQLKPNELLDEVIKFGNMHIFLRTMADLKIEPNFEHYYTAIGYGKVDIVAYFIAEGFHVKQHRNFDLPWNPKGVSPLSYALRFHQVACVRLLLAQGASLDDPCVIKQGYGLITVPTYYLIDMGTISEEMLAALNIRRAELVERHAHFASQAQEENGLFDDQGCSMM